MGGVLDNANIKGSSPGGAESAEDPRGRKELEGKAMFAQMTIKNNPDQTAQSFKERIEQPVLRGLVLSTIAGTFLGGFITFNVLMIAMTPATLAGAILAGAAVGANAGLLLFGLGDVIIAGRLEEYAELVEDAVEYAVLVDELQTDEKRGKESFDFFFRKAS